MARGKMALEHRHELIRFSLDKYCNFKIRGSQGDALVMAIPSISYGILKMVKLEAVHI
jgi:hypothetical protein